MFAKTIIDSDAFLDMPTSAQALYFHLSMRADDEGFVNAPRKIMRMVGASEDDARLLIHKKFIIVFDSGVIVIKHWRIHNYLRNDRFKPTNYREERAMLTVKQNGAYTLGNDPDVPELDTTGIPTVYQRDTQDSIGKDSIGKDSIGEDRKGDYKGETKFSPPSKDEIASFCEAEGIRIDIDAFIDHYNGNGWMVGKNKMKDWQATVRNWYRRDREKKGPPMQTSYDNLPPKRMDGDDLERLAIMMGVTDGQD